MMSNLKNSASQMSSTTKQDLKSSKSSYWLTKEEIQELHEDAGQKIQKAREYWAKLKLG